ncbi:MAG: tRNA pseudouridine(55) synthase TruB [Thermoleophilia bacterium]|nr:tRNA pseudouridine(55) synthase TruB [Thermoleophilia bacterium]
MPPDAREAPRAWLVDKPAGPTSHDVVAQVRRMLPRRTKVGHAGTLDPFATGLLVVLAGRATRLARLLSDRPKRYRATVRLGYRSATGDPEGPITPGGPVPPMRDVERVVAGMTGEQLQRVPAHAAVRVDGERLYARARRGEEVERPERRIVVYDLRLADADREAGDIVIDTHVSKGTYVRQLAADIGDTLGCGGYCLELRRTGVGDLAVDDAVPPAAVDPGGGIPLLELLAHMPVRELTPGELGDVLHGRPVPGDGVGEVVLAAAGEVAAVARAGDGMLRPSIVLRDPAGAATG